MKVFRSIELEEAMRAITHIQSMVKKDEGKAVSIAVVDVSGNLVAFANMGAKPVTVALAIAKAKTAILVEKPTLDLHLEGADPSMYVDLGVTCFGGGVPIRNNHGLIIGAIGVSGRKAGRVFLLTTEEGGTCKRSFSAEDILERQSGRPQDHELATNGADIIALTDGEL